MKKIVADTSIVINGQLVHLVSSGEISDCDVIIPTATLDELQSQATQNKEQGLIGLEELKKLQEIIVPHNITLSYEGMRPSVDDIKLSGRGRIDAIIKDIAKQSEAILYTSDRVQALVAEAEGVSVVYHAPKIISEKLEFLKFFDDETMSIHLKEGITPMAKKGKPGDITLTQIGEDVLTRDYLHEMSTQILEATKISDSGNVEISKPGALVIQYGDYRIAITRPPFSEKYEITIVHPIVQLSLDDYHVSDELMKRFSSGAEGILISGAPGSGKSTLASGLANYYNGLGKIVKTFESPRDLRVDPAITQYTRLDGSFENSADILLLVRPDYTVFDEVRRREDFRIFSDLRLTGVGMVGVVHANSPLDAIQRFIGKIELGIIPNVIDTVVFVKDGKISKVYELELKVKVPSGMFEQDLARPVIEIRNFENHVLEHEIYTFGEENVIVPVQKGGKKHGIEKLAEDRIRDVIKRFDPNAHIEILSDNNIRVKVQKQYIPSIIGKGGSTINDLQKLLNVHIDVEENDEDDSFPDAEIPYTFSESKTGIVLTVSREYTGMHADIYVADRYVTSSRIGRKGQIKIPKRSDSAQKLMDLASSKNDIQIYIKDF
ncbi:ATPase [Nitrosopumilus sp. b1]|uniref:PINc/VapC family ATPase n=1 Tax=Nitrosopumilus sp. b1 TaxID=2109907 RepID=UPI0015F675AF|nr:PINc/VapC family ATPase [Nitrosopumilus sp. b1]KAF6244041.1 ATPase [Nitrosopumilus sp. b1]